MAYKDATLAQKVELDRTLTNAGKEVIIDLSGGQWRVADTIDTVLGEAAAALAAVGAGGNTDPTKALVSDGQVLTVTGGKVTLHVADGVVSATYAADA